MTAPGIRGQGFPKQNCLANPGCLVMLLGLMLGSAATKRNVFSDWVQCWSTWNRLRRYPGLFSIADALLNWQAVLLPRRFSHRAAGRALAKEAKIENLPGGANRISVLGRGLVFYWLGTADNNLHYIIDQEFNPRFPHNYTTPPVELAPQSLILDVGACEGLFAFRVLRENRAGRVICFEPSAKNLGYARRAAQENGLADKIQFESMAVGKAPGRIRFVEESASPDAHSVAAPASANEGELIDCISLDEYCRSRKLSVKRQDLIKIDAEGSDLDVLLGAEETLRDQSPQIAVTTYHKPEHAEQIVKFLRSVQPAYRLRLKGFSSWTPRPAPVLLQAAMPHP